ncbi:hypothetical protein [Ellagibacter isourolithinifaciens]|uniref:hypothetical protein n=1 Tax=Ellagibacter isourolithinifaciens TaxID=2137581 RepID=UPI003AABF139
MAGDNHGDKTQEKPQAQEDLGEQQTAQEQPQVSGTDWEKAVAERDEKIAALEARVAEAAKNAEAAEQLRGEIAELQSIALLLHEFAHAGADVCPHVCRQRREVASVAALCRHLLWGAWLHWRVPPG